MKKKICRVHWPARPKSKDYESVVQSLIFYKVVGSSCRGRIEGVPGRSFERRDYKSNKRTKRRHFVRSSIYVRCSPWSNIWLIGRLRSSLRRRRDRRSKALEHR